MKTTRIIVILILGLCVPALSGCNNQKICSNGFYEINGKVVKKGIAAENNPTGMTAGTFWARVGDGYIRFKERNTWESTEINKSFVVKFDCSGWVISIIPSIVNKDFVVVGDTLK